MQRGWVLSSLGRYQDALEAFDRATTLKPDDHDAWEAKGGPLFALKRWKAYDEVTEKALSLDTECHLAWMNRGQAQYQMGRPWVEIAQSFDRAIGLRSEDPNVWFAKADRAGASGWLQEALDTFGKALELDPDFRDA